MSAGVVRTSGGVEHAFGPRLDQVGDEQRLYIATVVPRHVWENATGYQKETEDQWWLKAARERICVTRPPTTEVLSGPNDTGYFGGDSVRVVIEGYGRRVIA